MDVPKVFESEYRFCSLVWDNEPVNSGELVRLAADKLGWKKSTTYTVIRRLTERGVIKTDNAVVSSIFSREDIQRQECRDFIGKTFGGSLPTFIAAFSGGKLTRQEADALRAMIDEYEED